MRRSAYWPYFHGRFSPWATLFAEDNFQADNEPEQEAVSERVYGLEHSVLKETHEGFYLSFDLPGVKPQDVALESEENQLVISAKRTGRDNLEVKFVQRYTLPDTVLIEKIEAHQEHGVLTLFLPKQAQLKPERRKIEINTGEEPKTWLDRLGFSKDKIEHEKFQSAKPENCCN